jgi:hypothetical protein
MRTARGRRSSMRRALVLAALAAALVTASVATAGVYAGPKQWAYGEGAGSSYSSTWHRNLFSSYGGYDKAVTFIDNRTYSWHNTVRNSSENTETGAPPYPMVVKAHCVAYRHGLWGSCTVR